jgi:hypothetical protein
MSLFKRSFNLIKGSILQLQKSSSASEVEKKQVLERELAQDRSKESSLDISQEKIVETEKSVPSSDQSPLEPKKRTI